MGEAKAKKLAIENGTVEACGNCRYWLQVKGEGGLCRRYPPTPVFAGMFQPHPITGQQQPAILNYYAETAATFSCGEHKERMQKGVDLSGIDFGKLRVPDAAAISPEGQA